MELEDVFDSPKDLKEQNELLEDYCIAIFNLELFNNLIVVSGIGFMRIKYKITT